MNANDELNRYANRVSDADKETVRRDLGGMNRGPIAKIWHNVKGLWRMVCDPNAPKRSKIVALAALVYLVSPIDVVPDFIPVLGLLDDASVVSAAVAFVASDLKRYLDENP